MAGIKRSRDGGFSLLEVLISLVILAVGLLALAMFQVTAIKGNSIASKWTIATQLSQDKLESFRHAGWSAITSSPAGGFTTDGGGNVIPSYNSLSMPGVAGDNDAVAGTTFFRVWRVNNDSLTLRTITVWTCWQDDLANWHSVHLATQRTNIGGM